MSLFAGRENNFFSKLVLYNAIFDPERKVFLKKDE